MPTNTQRFGLRPAFLLLVFFCVGAESKCLEHCDLALASYYVWEGTTLTNISQYFETSIERIQSFNPNLTNKDIIHIGSRINIPFPCGCLDKQFLGHKFSYQIKSEDTYGKVAKKYYANLTTVEWLEADNIYSENRIPDVDTRILVPVNCSCGDRKVSKDFGLFVTYPLQPGESLSSIANDSGVSQEWLQRYNPDKNFSSGSGLVFIPGRDQNGTFPRLHLSKAGLSRKVIAAISVAGVAGALLLVFGIYTVLYRRKKYIEASLLTEGSEDHNLQHGNGSPVNLDKSSESAALVASPGLTGISVGRSVQFTYEELAKATNDFSIGNKIGQGGFGAVFYAELRGEKAAIKKMDMRASKEFLAELKVLTHVHHVNLVRLIGYCVQGSLFLVYEFIENGNLSQHLRGSGRDPLPWSTRVQIALDSARGLQYIHEHTVPVYIHRDIKSANILIDKNFLGKVADFGLTKLTEIGGASLYTSPVGTFGYMPPEYAFGEVSPKIDVYAFGVVLYELISGKEAIIRTNETNIESKGLVALFEDVLSNPDPIEGLHKLVDPRLGDNYPFESVHKMAWIARACTQGKALQRPSMRSVVVALTMLSSATEDLDVGSLYENQVLVNLMSGR